MKNNIDFYQHYANADQHAKFKMLRVKFGWAGEGRFWALNNRIAQADNCCIDVSKKYNAASIASDLGLSLDEFKKFIDCLENDCELIKECSPGVVTTDIVQENFKRHQKLMNNRLYNVDVKLWYSIIKRIFKRDNYICQYCGKHGGKLECDHILPISRGGTNEDGNLTTSCRKCNRQKKDKTPEEFYAWRAERCL